MSSVNQMMRNFKIRENSFITINDQRPLVHGITVNFTNKQQSSSMIGKNNDTSNRNDEANKDSSTLYVSKTDVIKVNFNINNESSLERDAINGTNISISKENDEQSNVPETNNGNAININQMNYERNLECDGTNGSNTNIGKIKSGQSLVSLLQTRNLNKITFLKSDDGPPLVHGTRNFNNMDLKMNDGRSLVHEARNASNTTNKERSVIEGRNFNMINIFNINDGPRLAMNGNDIRISKMNDRTYRLRESGGETALNLSNVINGGRPLHAANNNNVGPPPDYCLERIPSPYGPPPPYTTREDIIYWTSIRTRGYQDLEGGAGPVLCPHCQEYTVATFHYTYSILTYLACTVLCLSGCFCPCFWVPFCMDPCLKTRYHCSFCGGYLGLSHTGVF